MNTLRFKRPCAGAVLVAGAAALLWLFVRADRVASDTAELSAPKPVSVMTLENGPSQRTRLLPGQARAAREVHLAFRVQGPLRDLPVDVGQTLKKGDLIAKIDPRDFLVRVARLEAELKAQQARMADVRRTYERYRSLYATDAVPEAGFDQARADYESLNASIDATAQQLQAARDALNDTEMRAPFDGYVHEKFVESFDYVTAGQKVISFLDCSQMEVCAGLPEELLAEDVRFESFTCRFDVYPGIAYAARLKELARKPRASNQTYLLTVVIDTAAERVVVPGMAATVEVLFQKGPRDFGLAAPIQSVLCDEHGQNYVWRFDVDTNSVSRRDVETGGLTDQGIRIRKGLSAGDSIVVRGARFLYDGQVVRPVEND